MALDEKEKAVMDALEEEEQEENTMLTKLLTFSQEKIQFKIKSKAIPGDYAIVRCRPLYEDELLDIKEKLYKINKNLTSPERDEHGKSKPVPLTPEQEKQVMKIMSDTIKKTIIIKNVNDPRLKEILKNSSIKGQIFENVLERSSLSLEEIEKVELFRGHE